MPQALSQIVTEKAKNMIASGMSQTETAEELGISRKTANRINAAHRKEIEQLTLDIISKSVPLIRDNHINTLKIAHNILKASIDPQASIKDVMAIKDSLGILQLADKKEERALKIMGVMPAHTPSMVFNMLFAGQDSQDNKNLASVQKFLEWKRIEDLDAQEGEIIEDVGEKQVLQKE